MYYCNCIQSFTKAGRKVSKWAKEQGFMDFYLPVEVVPGDFCPHCSHHAIYSKVPLNQSPEDQTNG